jgi:N-acetylglucosamine malate deacetylase 1
MSAEPARVLAIAVHPDDETLGCGGTLLKHQANGSSIHWLLVTAATSPQWSDEQINQQSAQIEAVRSAYKFDSFTWLKLPTTELDRLPLSMIVQKIGDAVRKICPEWVYVPNRCDAHSDHRITAQAVHAVLKSFYLRSLGVKRVLACEVLSETDAAAPLPEHYFIPNVSSDITPWLEEKLKIMALFKTEVHPEPGPRSLSALRAQARLRGATCGVEYAECFMLIHEIS